MTTQILPGHVLGVLGGGQLGRMFALAARRMGYRVHVFSTEPDSPAGQVSDVEIAADYDDVDALRAFAGGVDVVTFEFENVPMDAVDTVEAITPVRPSGVALHTAQDRIREKTFLADHSFPTAEFQAAASPGELEEAVRLIGTPAVVKTTAFGYDGKGQYRVNALTDLTTVSSAIGHQLAVVEPLLDLKAEISVIGARTVDGSTAMYPPFENRHRDHILDITSIPANVPDHITSRASDIVRAILEELQYVGVLCAEFFITTDDQLLVNELAPRPHNSGHLTIEAAATSQFEQQVRAICGLPLGSPDPVRPSAMANLLGELWVDGEPNWTAAARVPGVSLHLYGKSQLRPGRKMGHLTAVAGSAAEAQERVVRARDALLL